MKKTTKRPKVAPWLKATVQLRLDYIERLWERSRRHYRDPKQWADYRARALRQWRVSVMQKLSRYRSLEEAINGVDHHSLHWFLNELEIGRWAPSFDDNEPGYRAWAASRVYSIERRLAERTELRQLRAKLERAKKAKKATVAKKRRRAA